MAKKRRSPTPHTPRSLEALRDRGFRTAIVERWIAAARKRIDAFGFADLLSFKPGRILLVQSTGNASPRGNPTQERLRQILGTAEPKDDREAAELARRAENARAWLEAGRCPCCGYQLTGIELYVWRRLKRKRGGTGYHWKPVLTEIELDDFPSPNSSGGAS